MREAPSQECEKTNVGNTIAGGWCMTVMLAVMIEGQF